MAWNQDEEDEDSRHERRLDVLSVMRGLWPYFASQRGAFLRATFFLAVSLAATLLAPHILGQILQAASERAPESQLMQLAGVFLALAIAGFIADFFMNMIMARSGLIVVTEIKGRLFHHLLNQAMPFFQEYPPGRLLARVESDGERLRQLFSQAAVRLTSSVLTFLGVITVMLIKDWRTTLAVVLALPVLAVLLVLATRAVRRLYRRSSQASARISAFLAEYVPAVSTLQNYSYEEETMRKLRRMDEEYVRVNLFAELVNYSFWGAFHLIEVIAVVSILAIGVPKVLAGTLELASMVVFVEYLRKVFWPMAQLSEFISFVQRGFVSGERILALLNLPIDERSGAARSEAPALNESLRLEDLRFSYGPEREAISGINLSLNRGETLALVGHSGGGKSTLANLLMTFLDPSAGRIAVDEIDLKDVTKRAWRRRIGLVPQELQLFPGSLRENLTVFGASVEGLSRPEADKAIDRALEIAQASALVKRLGGLDAPIAERGANLSQGERQLLSFARALVHDPSLLVLDEATASVDPATERRIQDSLERALQGRSAIVIAHRLATITGADKIAVIAGGKVVAQGRHEELLRDPDPTYRHLVELQLGEAGGARHG